MNVANDTNGDLGQIMARLDDIQSQLAGLSERQEKQAELLEVMTPIARDVMDTSIDRLQALEDKGWFRFGKELGGVADRIVTGFSPEDVRLLGDQVVAILGTVRSLTQPDVLAVANQAAEALQRPERAAPVGLYGMMRASKDADVRKGFGVMLEVLRRVGQGASQLERRRDRIASRLAPRDGGRRLPSAPDPTARRTQDAEVVCKPARPSPGDPGFVDDWSRDYALRVAGELGVELNETAWAVIEWSRAQYVETEASPNIRRITRGAGVGTREIYTIFPKAPGRAIARIAGIPKPGGCI